MACHRESCRCRTRTICECLLCGACGDHPGAGVALDRSREAGGARIQVERGFDTASIGDQAENDRGVVDREAVLQRIRVRERHLDVVVDGELSGQETVRRSIAERGALDTRVGPTDQDTRLRIARDQLGGPAAVPSGLPGDRVAQLFEFLHDIVRHP